MARPSAFAWRVFAAALVLVLVVLATVQVVATRSGRRAARESERRGLEQAADFTAQLLAGRGRSLGGGARVFVQGPYFRALVAERRRDDILDQAFEASEQLGADWVFITDERGTLLAKSDEPSAQGVAMGSIPLVAGALEGRTVSGYGVSRDTLLFQAVAVPIVVPGAAPVGVLVATKAVDAQVAQDVHASTGMDVVFYSVDARGAARLSTTSFTDTAPARAILATATTQDTQPAAQQNAARELRVDGVRYMIQGAALTTAGGEIVGGFLVARSDRASPAGNPGLTGALALAVLVGLALSALAAWLADRLVARPSRALALVTTNALDGCYESPLPGAGAGAWGVPEEITRVAHALGALVEELREKQAVATMLGSVRGARAPDAPVGSVPPDDEPPVRGGSGRLGAPSPRGRQGASVARAIVSRFAARAPDALAVGSLVADRYMIQELIGNGATGTVYRALDRTLGEPVAIKVLRAEILSDGPEAGEELTQVLQRVRVVRHRNVVRVHDACNGRGLPFLTMELVEGPSLVSVLAERGPLPVESVLALAKQLTRALEAAHADGVMHGDLKPGNVLLASDGTAKVTDFGIAAMARRPRGRRGTRDDVVTPPHLAGATVGTPEYMAPEQLLGEPPSVAADLYAAGVLLHECLTGSTPFPREAPPSVLARKLEDVHAHQRGDRDTDPSRGLDGLVAWMTAHDPARRPSSAAAVREALARLG